MPEPEHAKMMLTVARRDLKAMDGMKTHLVLTDFSLSGNHSGFTNNVCK